MSDTTAAAPPPTPGLVPDTVLARLTGRAGLEYGTFSGTVYNGSDSWQITELRVGLTPQGQQEHRVYKVDVIIDPLTTKRFRFLAGELGPPEKVHWQITAAYGVQLRQLGPSGIDYLNLGKP